MTLIVDRLIRLPASLWRDARRRRSLWCDKAGGAEAGAKGIGTLRKNTSIMASRFGDASQFVGTDCRWYVLMIRHCRCC